MEDAISAIQDKIDDLTVDHRTGSLKDLKARVKKAKDEYDSQLRNLLEKENKLQTLIEAKKVLQNHESGK